MIAALVLAEIWSIRWRPLLVGFIAAAGFLLMAASQDPTFVDRHLFLRFAGVCMAVGFVFACEDLGGELQAAFPVPLRTRVAIRWMVLGVTWLPVSVVIALLAGSGAGLDAGSRLILESGGLASLGFLFGTISARVHDDRYGQLAASGLAIAFLASWALPDPVSPWQVPGSVRWNGWEAWWTAILAGSTLAAIVVGWDARRR